jgi:hypothetical protein
MKKIFIIQSNGEFVLVICMGTAKKKSHMLAAFKGVLRGDLFGILLAEYENDPIIGKTT